MIRVISIALLSLLVIAGCKKKNSTEEGFSFPYDGTASGMLNGQVWNAKLAAGYFGDNPGSYTIRIASQDSINQLEHYLAITGIPFESAIDDTLVNYVHSPMPSDSPSRSILYQRFLANDLLAGAWIINSELPHRIVIRYDPLTKELSGSLEAGFVSGIDTSSSSWARPVHFTKLSFSGKLRQYVLDN